VTRNFARYNDEGLRALWEKEKRRGEEKRGKKEKKGRKGKVEGRKDASTIYEGGCRGAKPPCKKFDQVT